jgi:hypothetical protein
LARSPFHALSAGASGAPGRLRLRQRPVAAGAGYRGHPLRLGLIPVATAVDERLRDALLSLISFVGGVLAVHKTGVDLGVIDHGSIVWDEIVPFWLVLLFCPAHWLWQTTAFCLFRFFDIVKPQPARYFDEKVKNGLRGDELTTCGAAGYTLLVIGHSALRARMSSVRSKRRSKRLPPKSAACFWPMASAW